MPTIRIAMANIRAPVDREDSIRLALDAMEESSTGGAAVVCFPECFLPGYRVQVPHQLPPDPDWLAKAWSTIDKKAADLCICVVLGTERIDKDGNLMISVRVTNSDGSLSGFQDKVQLDPSEDSMYVPGSNRRVFKCGGLTFGVVICHEGWRYPETVRWAARRGAHVVFHPHFEVVEDDKYRPKQFADPGNTFHEKAALCRAAENTCYFATVNCALQGAHTTSALVDPEGNLVAHQPYGKHGILFAAIDTEKANGLLAKRLTP